MATVSSPTRAAPGPGGGRPHPVVHYIPREDVDMSLLTRTEHATHCPYKGDAAYYTIDTGDRTVDNAIWTYEAPFPAVADIAGHLAFFIRNASMPSRCCR